MEVPGMEVLGMEVPGTELPAAGTVQVDFSLALGRGRLDASSIVPSGEQTLTELLPVLQHLSSNIVASAVEIVEREGHRISCRAGCGACCRQLVPISLFEAEHMAGWVRALPVAEQRALEGRFHGALLQLGESGLLERMDPAAGLDRGEKVRLAIDYLAHDVACPFLVEESCGIYASRPMICREYLVTSPPEFCRSPSEFAVVGVPIPLKLSQALVDLGGQVEPGSRGWMPLVFLFAWMKCGARPGEAIHGPGPEVLYEVVKRLSSAS